MLVLKKEVGLSYTIAHGTTEVTSKHRVLCTCLCGTTTTFSGTHMQNIA
jgi:hypothetical protein